MSYNLKNVVLLDKIDPLAKTLLDEAGIGGHIFTKFADIPSELQAELNGLVVRSATTVTPEIMAACPNLKVIGRAGTGVDNINVQEASARGILVMNTPNGNTISAAEHTCAMICSLARMLPNNNLTLKSHKWVKSMGNELLGKTLGIIGLGRIGQEVAIRMQSFGMTTIGFDPLISAEVSKTFGVNWMTLDEMWPLCDYITVHTPLIPQTKNLLCTNSFAVCKKGVKVVNCARGGIINESDLLEALESGQCGGAALDVFVDEPPKDWTLVDHPKVVATGHLGASTREAQLRCGEHIAKQLIDLSKGLSLVGGINAPAVGNALSEENSNWVSLAKAMGKIAGKCVEELKGNWNINIFGKGPEEAKRFIPTAVASGLMSTHGQTNVNLINAASLANNADVVMLLGTTEFFHNGIEVKAADGSIVVRGVLNGMAPLLATVNDSTFKQGANITSHVLMTNDPLSSVLEVVTSQENFLGIDVANSESGTSWKVIRFSKAPANDLCSKFKHSFIL